MAILGRTRAVGEKMIEDIRKIVFYTTIVVQFIFFAFYGYSIYNNINKLTFLIIYASLLGLSAISFINFLITYNNSSKANKHFKRFLRVLKYLANGTMLVISAYEIIKFSGSNLSKIILIASALSLFVQVIFEFIRIFIEKYTELFIVSAQMDLQFVTNLMKIKEVKGNLLELIEDPLEAIANKHERKEQKPSKTEEYVNRLADEFDAKHKEKAKEHHQKRVDEQKKEIVEHIHTIKNFFKRDSK